MSDVLARVTQVSRMARLAATPMAVGVWLSWAAALAQPAMQPPAASVPQQRNLIERTAPVAPLPSLGPSAVPPPPARVTGPGENQSVRIVRSTVQGNTALSEAELRPLVAAADGQTVPLSRIEDMRLAVLRAYREAGYPYVAVNTGLAPVAGGAELRFGVVEGFVAEVRLENDIGPAGVQVQRFLSRVVGEHPLSTAALERALLLASDVPGVSARGRLRPLAGEPGALQLVVTVARKPFSGYVTVDNRGYQLSGPWQGLLVGSLNSFSSLGERTEVDFLEAQGNTQTFGQVSEEFFLGGSGLRLRLYGGAGRAAPGSVLAAIGYKGETRVGGGALTYPVIRSRPYNLSVVGQFDIFESSVDTSQSGTPQRASFDSVRTFRLGLEGSARDTLVPFAPRAAVNTVVVRLSKGVEGLGSSTNGRAGVGRTGSNFDFSKLSGEVTRNQPLYAPTDNLLFSAEVTVAGQLADSVLPLSEKFYLGGTRLGRGFYSGQITGDNALGISAELQLNTGFDLELPLLRTTRIDTQFYAFRDYGQTWERQSVDPNRHLSSFGGGVRLAIAENTQIDLEVVRRVTRTPNAEGLGAKRLDAVAGFGRLVVRY